MFSIIAYFFHFERRKENEVCGLCCGSNQCIAKKYTYKNVFKDYLTMVANWNCDVHRFEDGVSFDDVVEEYAVKDLVELSRCAFALYNTGARNVNFLLAVNDTLNNEDHDEMHDFIIEKFS